jgi:hypothetical protein
MKSRLFDSETARLFASKILLRPLEMKKVHQASVLVLRFLMQPLQHVNERHRMVRKERSALGRGRTMPAKA